MFSVCFLFCGLGSEAVFGLESFVEYSVFVLLALVMFFHAVINCYCSYCHFFEENVNVIFSFDSTNKKTADLKSIPITFVR